MREKKIPAHLLTVHWDSKRMKKGIGNVIKSFMEKWGSCAGWHECSVKIKCLLIHFMAKALVHHTSADS